MKSDQKSSLVRLRHILNAVRNIQAFTLGISYEEFTRDPRTYYACLYQFAIIGEAIVRIDTNMLEGYDYPWYKVRSFRNFIMHEYHAIDEKVVWDTIEQELPEFGKLIEHILEVG